GRCRSGRLRIRMDSNPTEVMPDASLHEGSSLWIERHPAAGADDTAHQRIQVGTGSGGAAPLAIAGTGGRAPALDDRPAGSVVLTRPLFLFLADHAARHPLRLLLQRVGGLA